MCDVDLSGEYHADCNKLMDKIKELKTLVNDVLPEMEARTKGLQELWPGRDVLLVLHRNESLVKRMKNI